MKTRVQWNLQWNWQLNTHLILIGIERYFKFYDYSYIIILDSYNTRNLFHELAFS